MSDSIWKLNLEGRAITHIPSGLIISFKGASDGSGMMQADLVNPEQLPKQATPEEMERLARLPMEAWKVYSAAAAEALARLDP